MLSVKNNETSSVKPKSQKSEPEEYKPHYKWVCGVCGKNIRKRTVNGLCITCFNKSDKKKKALRRAKNRLGQKHTEETKRKIRISVTKDRKSKNAFANYNREACKIIDEYGKKHGYNFQHAMNGGEVIVCGYWLDGYDKERNTAIEYYETYKHFKKQRQDKLRKQKIIKEINCDFIEIKEWEYNG